MLYWTGTPATAFLSYAYPFTHVRSALRVFVLYAQPTLTNFAGENRNETSKRAEENGDSRHKYL